jgi:two-component system, NtrC family, response regulator HydG
MKPPTALLVSQSDSHAALHEFLDKAGFEVHFATSILNAIWKIEKEPFDLLITDLRLRRHRDGIRLLAAMRRMHPKSLRIVVLDAVDAHVALMAFPVPVGFVVKPFEVEQVAKLVSKSQLVPNWKGFPTDSRRLA